MGEVVSPEAFRQLQTEMELVKKTNAEINLKCNALLGRYQELVNASVQNFNMYQERISIIEKGVKMIHGNVVNLEKRFNAQTIPQPNIDKPGIPEGTDEYVTKADLKRSYNDLYQMIENLNSGSEKDKDSIAAVKDSIKREVTSNFIGELEKMRQRSLLVQKEVGQIKTQLYTLQTVDLENIRGGLFTLQVSQKNDADFNQEFSTETKKQLDTLKKRVKSLSNNPLSDPQQIKAELGKINNEFMKQYELQISDVQQQITNSQSTVIKHFVETVRRLIAIDRLIYSEAIKTDKSVDDKLVIRITVQAGVELGDVAGEALAQNSRVKITIPSNTTVKWNKRVRLDRGAALTIEGESYSTSVISMDSEIRDGPARAIVGGFGSLNLNGIKIVGVVGSKAAGQCGLFEVSKSDAAGPGVVVISNCDADADEDLVFVGAGAFGWVGLQGLSLTNSAWASGRTAHPVEVFQAGRSPSGFALVSQKAVNLCGEGVAWSGRQPLIQC